MYKLIKKDGNARRGEFETVHGTVQTPAFMNVATCGAIKGALSAIDLKEIGCQVMLSNTYHLHVRPGDKLVNEMGGPAVILAYFPFKRCNGFQRSAAGCSYRKNPSAVIFCSVDYFCSFSREIIMLGMHMVVFNIISLNGSEGSQTNVQSNEAYLNTLCFDFFK